jgi:hypothetical protein
VGCQTAEVTARLSKGGKDKRTTELVSIGGKDIAHSRYYNILLADAMTDEEQRELNNK